MKKKLIQILTLLVVAVSVGSFVSCKDTNEDLYNDLRTQTATALNENASLRDALQQWAEKLEKQIKNYEDLLNAINSCNCDPSAISTINGKISNMENDITNLSTYINGELGTINALITALQNGLSDKADQSAVDALTTMINNLTSQVTANTTLLGTLTNLPNDVADQQALIAVLQTEIANLKAWKETVKSCECEKYTEVLETLAKLQQEMTDAKDKVDAAIANVTNLATAANTAATDAKATAESAKAIAEAATTAAQNAFDFALTVEQKADQAGLTATAAQETADKAWELATEALIAANAANALATEVITIKEAVAANTADIASNKEAIQALQTTTETIYKLINDNKTELLQKISDLTDRLSADETEYSTKIAENAANIVKNAENIAKNAENIEKNAQAIAKAQQDISDLSAQISAMNATISVMSTDLQAAFNKASEAAATANANSIEIAALKAIVEGLQTAVTDLQNGSDPTTSTEIQTLKETIQNLQSSITTLEQNLASQISSLSQQANGNTNAITQLQQALADLKEAAGKTDQAVIDLTTRVNDLLDRLSALEATVQALDATCAANLAAAKEYADLLVEAAKNELLLEVQEMLKAYLKSGDIDLSNYVTKEEVANYIAREELANYATKEELANYVTQDVLDALSDKVDGITEAEAALRVALANLTQEMYDKFLSEGVTIAALQERIRANEVDIQWLKDLYGDINDRTGNLETWKEQIETWQTMILEKLSEIEGGTSTTIIERITEIKEEIKETILQDLNTTLATTVETLVNDELTSNLGTILDSYNFVTQDQIEGLAQALIDLAELKNNLQNLQNQVDNLPDYGTRVSTLEEQIAALQDATSGLAQLIADVNTLKSIDFSNFATKDDLNNLATKDDLNNYALVSDLIQYVKTADLLVILSQYAGKDEFDTFKQQVLDALQDCVSQDKITEIENKITQLENAINNSATKQDLTDLKNEINSELATTLADYVTNEKLNEYLADYAKTSDLANYVQKDELNDYVKKDELDEKLSGYATVGALTTLSDELNAKLNDYLTISAFNSAKEELLDMINTNATDISNIKTRLDAAESDIETMKTDIQDLKTRVEAAETLLEQIQQKYDAAIDELRTDVTALQDALAKQVTGIIVQGTKNPMFGTFSLPTNTQTNVLIAFYGVPHSDVVFPDYHTGAYGIRADQALSEEEINMLKGMGLEVFKSPAENPLLAEKGSAGKVYMTINPNTADLSGLQLSLVNTLDEESPIKLRPIVKSEEKLQFGYTRANNGFYEADAYVTPYTVTHEWNGIALTKEDIQAVYGDVKEAIKELGGGTDAAGHLQIGQMASDVYNLISKLHMDQRGLKCTYTTTEADGSEKEHSVYSQYNLAATFFNPLNLDTGKDFHYVTIPGYEAAENLFNKLATKAKDKVHVFFKDFNSNSLVEKIGKLKINNIDFNIDQQIADGKFIVSMDTTIIIDGLSYHLQMPVDVNVPVKFEKDLTINLGGLTVPIHVEQDVAVDLSGVTVTSPTVVVTGTATGTATTQEPVLDPETGLPMYDGEGNAITQLSTVLVVPVTDDLGNIVGYTEIPLDDINVTANINASGTVGDGEITLDGSPIAHVVIDQNVVLGSDQEITYHLVIEDSFATTVNLDKWFYFGDNGTDKKSFNLHIKYDMSDLAQELLGIAESEIAGKLDDVQDIIDEVNNLIQQINTYEGKINEAIDDVVDNYLMKYLNKINSTVVNFVNSFNRRLQPFMVASTSKGFKRLSEVKAYPTMLSSDVTVYPTTKTMEIFVPLARKHVAVTNVYKNGSDATALGGNGDCMAKLTAVNTAGNMNKILDGTVRNLKISGMVPGYVYEIAYSVLDFDGNMSTHKYYVEIQQ